MKPTSGRGRRYHYIGGETGIPGLPHDVTEEEAQALGVAEILAAAIANGSYRETSTQGARAETPAAKEE